MQTQQPLSTISAFQGTTSRQTPLHFLENSVLAFSRSRNSNELNSLLDSFFDPDLIDYLGEHANELLVLGMAWTANIRRVVFAQKNVVFPNKLLLLPPLYQGLGWTDRQNEEWNSVHAETLGRHEQSPALNNAILLLFLDGMRCSLEEACFLFGARLEQLGTRSSEYETGIQLLEELKEYGWPTLTKPSSLM